MLNLQNLYEEHYQDLVNGKVMVNHQTVTPDDLRIHIFQFPLIIEDEPGFVLLTDGMSEKPLDPGDGSALSTELLWYVRQPTDVHFHYMRYLAKFPHLNDTCFLPGHTFQNGNPPEPIFSGSHLTTFMFLEPPFQFELDLAQKLSIENPFKLLWIFPITDNEMAYKQEYKTAALIDRLEQLGVFEPVLDETR